MTVTELVAKLGLKIDEGSFEKGTKTLEGLVKAAKAVTAAFVAQEGFKFMREIATAAMEDAHAVQKMSERFGVGAQELQKLGAAAGDLGIEGVGHAMKFLSTNAYNAAQGTGNAGEAFSRLGVSVRDQNGQMKTADVLMGDIADGMMRIHDPMERTALATSRRKDESCAPIIHLTATGTNRRTAAVTTSCVFMRCPFLSVRPTTC